MNLEEHIELAKRAVERKYGAKPGERRWPIGTTPPSYDDTEYEVSLFVLEGSRPKGFVLVYAGHNGHVLALDNGFKRIRGPWE